MYSSGYDEHMLTEVTTYIRNLADTHELWVDERVHENKVLFWPNATVDNSNYDTYYCDDMYVDASCLAYVGGGRSDGSYAGAFHMNLYYGVSDSSNDLWSRIMFL